MVIDTEDITQVQEYEDKKQDLIYEKRDKGKYDSSDIALVRVTGFVPMDGVAPAICNVPFLVEPNSMQNFVIHNYLKKQFVKREGNAALTEEKRKELNQIARSLTPLSSEYRSSVHFALNGAVSDHAYGTFPGKLVIIDPFTSHENDSNILSVRPEDTYFKDGVSLSPDAVVLAPIELENELPDCGVKYVFYNGDRDEAVNMYLVLIGIVPEEIRDSYVEGSRTSDMLRAFITENGYDQTKHSQSSIRDEDFKKSEALQSIYDKMFYDHLFGIAFPNGEHRREYDLLTTTSGENWIVDFERQDALTNIIDELGLEKYSQIVISFNEGIRERFKKHDIPTNNELLGITPTQIPKHNNTR